MQFSFLHYPYRHPMVDPPDLKQADSESETHTPGRELTGLAVPVL